VLSGQVESLRSDNERLRELVSAFQRDADSFAAKLEATDAKLQAVIKERDCRAKEGRRDLITLIK
jgi:hypothetical protein